MIPPKDIKIFQTLQVIADPRSSRSDHAIALSGPGDLLSILRHVEVTERGCWLWTRALDDSGYGITTLRGQTVRVHRAVWAFAHGRVPDRSLEIDHTCSAYSEKRCCAPDHLEEVTHQENMRRAVGRRIPPETCRKGHKYGEHPRWNSRGHRVCRTCDSVTQQAYRDRRKEKARYRPLMG